MSCTVYNIDYKILDSSTWAFAFLSTECKLKGLKMWLNEWSWSMQFSNHSVTIEVDWTAGLRPVKITTHIYKQKLNSFTWIICQMWSRGETYGDWSLQESFHQSRFIVTINVFIIIYVYLMSFQPSNIITSLNKS